MTSIIILQQRLEEAELAYHRLVMGEGVVQVTDQNRESVIYSKADLGKLKNYIAELKAEISGVQPKGPLKFIM